MAPNKKKNHRNEKTYRTQTLKKKTLEETNIFNTFILVYFYSRWSGLLILKSIFQCSLTDADSPTSTNYNEGFTLLSTGTGEMVYWGLQKARS